MEVFSGPRVRREPVVVAPTGETAMLPNAALSLRKCLASVGYGITLCAQPYGQPCVPLRVPAVRMGPGSQQCGGLGRAGWGGALRGPQGGSVASPSCVHVAHGSIALGTRLYLISRKTCLTERKQYSLALLLFDFLNLKKIIVMPAVCRVLAQLK